MSKRPEYDFKTPQRERRLKIVAHVGKGGAYGRTRDVYMESRITDEWVTDMFNMDNACEPIVCDLIRWADSVGLKIVYIPAGNMGAYFDRTARKRTDQDMLFT